MGNIRLHIHGVRQIIEEGERFYRVTLREVGGQRRCIMHFSPDFYSNIRIAITSQNTHTPQDIAHGWFVKMLRTFHVTIRRVVISGMSENSLLFEAHLLIGSSQMRKRIGASDGLSIALHAGCPILISERVLDAHERQRTLFLRQRSLDLAEDALWQGNDLPKA